MTSTKNTEHDFPDHIVDWLASHLTGEASCELITSHPWAQTYRLQTEDAVYFLKLLPHNQRATLPAISQLAKQFPANVPSVLALSEEHGLLLLRDHQGETATSTKHSDVDRRILETYAEIQAHAASNRDLMTSLPTDAPRDLPERFIRFFTASSTPSGSVAAEHFLGQTEAAKYADRLSLRLPLLQNLIQQTVERLPNTVNHGDLRHKNVAIRADQSVILFDWDDVSAGPVGYSLHNFFSGCSRPAALLLDLPSAVSIQSDQKQLLFGYIAELARHGYASHEDLRMGLPGALSLGVMSYILSFAKFPIEHIEDREVIAKILKRRTDDLIKLCDELSLAHRNRVIKFSSDHLERGDFSDAARLLQRFLGIHPNDHEIRYLYANALYEKGDNSDAIQQCRIGLEQNPWHPELRRLSGDCALEDLDLDSAIDHWNLAVQQSPDHKQLRAWIADVQKLRDDIESLDAPDTVPVVRLSDTSLSSSTLTRLKVRVAARLFREFGTLVIENAFSNDLLSRLHSEFLTKYDPLLQGGHVENALKVGNDRYMMTLDIEGSFNSPEVYANRFLQKLFTRLLGSDYVLGSFTAVTSLAGAPDMRVHKDHPALFPEDNSSTQIPTFAITVLLPLLGMTSELGTTRVVKGSHRKSSEDSACMPHQDPLGPAGSCLLMDYRLTHQGLANRSNKVRPVLSMVYNRPWFRDAVNYRKQPPLALSVEEFSNIPEAHQNLMQWFVAHRDQVAT
jgi:tetratricopeptide (TPR) repeat protein